MAKERCLFYFCLKVGIIVIGPLTIRERAGKVWATIRPTRGHYNKIYPLRKAGVQLLFQMESDAPTNEPTA